MLGLLVTIVCVVLAVARSKFRQRQYFLTQFTDMLFCYCYKCFFNILINHYIVCEQAFIFKHHVPLLWVGPSEIICESVSVTDSLSRLTQDSTFPSLYFQMSMNNDHHFFICFMHMYNC